MRTIIICLTFFLCSCSGEEESQGQQLLIKDVELIGDYEYEGIPYDESAPEEVKQASSEFIPQNLDIHEYSKATIKFNGNESTIVLLKYGELRDCPSGCFSSNICTIVEDDQPHLYSANWYDKSEEPLTLDESCTTKDYGSSIYDCNIPPSGVNLPVASSQEFVDLVETEGSEFRWCS